MCVTKQRKLPCERCLYNGQERGHGNDRMARGTASVQFESMRLGLADQAISEKEKSLRDTQESLNLIDKQTILKPDMQQLNTQTDNRYIRLSGFRKPGTESTGYF